MQQRFPDELAAFAEIQANSNIKQAYQMHVRFVAIETIRDALGLDWNDRNASTTCVVGDTTYRINVDSLPSAVDPNLTTKTYNNHRTYERWASRLLFESSEALHQEDAAPGYLRSIEAATLSGIHRFLTTYLQEPFITTPIQNHSQASVISMKIKDLAEKLKAGRNILESIAKRHNNSTQEEVHSGEGSGTAETSEV